jgi:uncharacterized protein (TIGR00255 family)
VIRSMTGYGEASVHVDGVHYFLEVRSLNNKYFKGVIRLPEEFQSLEAELETRLREKVNRGTVTLTATCTAEASAAAHSVNTPVLRAYLAQVEETRKMLGKDAPALTVDAAALLALPGVLQPPTHGEDRLHKARASFLGLLDKALGGLLAMRDREGAALAKEFEGQLKLIGERLVLIRTRSPDVVTEYEKRLKARIEQMLREAELKVEVGDLIREIAIYAERIDIAEETQRLGGHLEQFGDLVGQPEYKPIGRTLDFVAQEMLREANTIASKSPDAATSRWTVEIKGAIDRIKEQSANVE